MVLFVLRKLILQTRMRSHPVGLDVWFFVGPFVYFHSSRVRTAEALVRLRGCAGSPEPSLVAYVISTIISWAGSNVEPQSRLFVRFPTSLNNVPLITEKRADSLMGDIMLNIIELRDVRCDKVTILFNNLPLNDLRLCLITYLWMINVSGVVLMIYIFAP